MSLLNAEHSNPREGGPSFSLRHRLLRVVWGVVWHLFGSWTPVPMHGWRRTLLRAFGADVHPTARVYPGVKVWYPPNLVMREFSCMAGGVNCYCMDRVELGAYALVSQDAYLCGGTHDIDDPSFQLVARPILIGCNAWVAAKAFVGPGVTIGDNAVLGGGAVAFKNLEADMVYVGNPAKAVRWRTVSPGTSSL